MRRSIPFAFAALAAGSQLAIAEENLWIYTKGTDTRPEGSIEFKLSDIIREGKNSGDYTFHDIRPEIEYGITDRLTVGAEVMIFRHDYSVNSEDLEPMVETQGGIGGRFKDTQVGGYEFAMKYMLMSPYKDSFGLALAIGYENREKYRLDGASIDQDSFTITWLGQKNFLDDTLTTAINFKTEFERRSAEGGSQLAADDVALEEEIAFDISAAISYRVAPKWFVGLEFRHQSDYLSPERADGTEDDPELKRSKFDIDDFRIGSQHQKGNYLGPTVHYAEKDWWVTAGILWQIHGGGRAGGDANSSGRNWDEHEHRHIGFSIGYEM